MSNNPKRKIERKVEPVNLTEVQDKECRPVAYHLLTKLGEYASKGNMPIGSSFNDDQRNEYFNSFFTHEVEPAIRAANLKIDDVGYLLSIILEAFDTMKNKTLRSVESAVDQAAAKKWGLNDVSELRINDVIEAQKLPMVAPRK